MEQPDPTEYYLEVVKDGAEPKWPKDENDLLVGSQPLDSGFTQFWAYPKEGGREADDLPHAEVIAAEHKADQPAILVDNFGPSDELELVLAKDGHAWGKAQSSLDNLEDNISALLDFGKNQFNMEVEHFMTTGRVSPEVNKKLDELEEVGEAVGGAEPEDQPESKLEPDEPSGELESAEEPATAVADSREEEPAEERPIRPVNSGYSSSIPSNIYASNRPSDGGSKGWVIPLLVILLVFGAAVVFKDRVMSLLGGGQKAVPTETSVVTLTPTPTPTPSLDRSQYKIRVLNGTLKSGAASVLADDLKAKGWQTLPVGNATNSATPQTFVRAKQGLDLVQATLIADLNLDQAASSSSALAASDKADAEVVIGLK